MEPHCRPVRRDFALCLTLAGWSPGAGRLGGPAESVLTALRPAAGELEAIAIDGKTPRGEMT